MDSSVIISMLEHARLAAAKAYAPYSRFRVGAALLSERGDIISGFNIENRSYGLTVCAERTALQKAIIDGTEKIRAVAVYAMDSENPVSPCGACRQVLSEFCGPETLIIFKGSSKKVIKCRLRDLFPYDALHDLKR